MLSQTKMSQTSPNRSLTKLFFAGTDTDVGKTFTAALVARRYRELRRGRVGVYKPVASGCRRHQDDLIADDAVMLWEAAGRPKTLQKVCPQRFEAPLAPTQAASLEGKRVDPGLLLEGARAWQEYSDLLIIEGAGGLMSPLAESVLNVDLVKQLEGSGLVIVAANRLGVIHQTLATCAAAQHFGVQPAAVILCQVDSRPDPSAEHNAAEITRYTCVPVLGCVRHAATFRDIAFVDELLG